MAVSDTVAINSFRSPPICVCLSHLGTTVDGRNPTTAYQLVQDDLPTTAVLICCCWFRWGKKQNMWDLFKRQMWDFWECHRCHKVKRSKTGGGEAVFAVVGARRPSFFFLTPGSCFSNENLDVTLVIDWDCLGLIHQRRSYHKTYHIMWQKLPE